MMGDLMPDNRPSEDHEVKRTTEARQAEVGKGAPMKWVLIVSVLGAALALLIIYFAFVAA